jgi:predicted MFS family arabinose efflux permease
MEDVILASVVHSNPRLIEAVRGTMSQRKQLVLFFSAIAFMACATGVHDSIFNNFLSDTFDISEHGRGMLEFPRETPGFLVVLTAGLLAALPLTRVGTGAALTFAIGMVGIGSLGDHFWIMVGFMCLASTGLHLIQPIGATIALGLSDESARGRRMGQMGMVETSATVLGAGMVWLCIDKTAPQYRTVFFCAALLACVAALIYALLNVPHLHKPRPRIVFNARYKLYYLLELVAGARKQIFLTFGPWVLIKVYHREASSMASLLMIAGLIGIVFKPTAGIIIDRFGERAVMIADNLLLIFVCLGYGYATTLTGDPDSARLLASGCYIADNLLFTLSLARAVYISRITPSPQDLNSTLSAGVSINHIASMTIPIGAGYLWSVYGYERVFLAASILALLTAFIALRVPRKKRSTTA